MLTASERDDVIAILDAAQDLTVATIREDGWPQANVVSFVNDGMKIYFGTAALAQKAHNIERDNRVSVTVTDPYRTWEEIRGLSIGGRAIRVTTQDETMAVGVLMLRKFPQLTEFVDFGAGLDMALFRIDAEIISLLDYRRGFGHAETLKVA